MLSVQINGTVTYWNPSFDTYPPELRAQAHMIRTNTAPMNKPVAVVTGAGDIVY